jgi:hypothetical protein
MARRRSSGLDNADFAAAVIDLYKHAIRGKLAKFSGNQDREVRRVAFGLTIIRQLVERELRASNAPVDPATPLIEGLAIIDALTGGRDHPIWRHIAGLRSGRFRPQNAPPNLIEELRRACVVGLVRAYAQTATASQRAAREAVIKACRFNDFEFGAEQIKRWDRTYREQQDQGPDAFANEFIKRSKTLKEPPMPEDRVLRIGRDWIWRLCAVPDATNDSEALGAKAPI